MAARETEEQEIIRNISYQVIAQIAPGELPLFEHLCREYFRRPDRPLAGDEKDEPLGFDPEFVATLMTLIVLPLVSEVTKTLLSVISKTAGKKGTDKLLFWLRARFKKRAGTATQVEKPAVPPLTAEQLALARQVSYQKAQAMGMTPERAALLADAITGSLVIGPKGKTSAG